LILTVYGSPKVSPATAGPRFAADVTASARSRIQAILRLKFAAA
jgi:hypothetical protein